MTAPAPHGVLATGARRLKLLARHADALMRAYAGGALAESDFSEGALQELITARVLWHNAEDGHLRLGHKLRELIAEMIADEQRRQTHADVAEALDRLRTLVNRYLAAQHRTDYAAVSDLKLALTEAMDDFNSRLADAIDSLWQRLNSDFGFAKTLEDKIAENERARGQVQRLLSGLELIDFDEWIALVGSEGFLRRLLVSQWQRRIAQHLQSLRSVQERLTALILRFRKQQARARLVRGMAQFLRTHIAWQWPDYAHRSVLPEGANQATPLLPHAFPDLARASDQQVLIELLARLPRQQGPLAAAPVAEPVPTPMTPDVKLLQREVQQAAEAFFMDVADGRGTSISALDWWRERGEPFDAGIWLLQVLAEYEGLPRAQRAAFELQAQEEPASAYNRLYLVRDYHLKLCVGALAATD